MTANIPCERTPSGLIAEDPALGKETILRERDWLLPDTTAYDDRIGPLASATPSLSFRHVDGAMDLPYRSSMEATCFSITSNGRVARAVNSIGNRSNIAKQISPGSCRER